MFKNKKGSIAEDVIFFIIMTFLYFLIGLPLVSNIIDSIIESTAPTGIILYAMKLAPFIPMLGLLYFAWKKTRSEEESPSLFGGGQ